mgnify:CR=1 FL=1
MLRCRLKKLKSNRYLHGVGQSACATPIYPPYPTTSPSSSSRFLVLRTGGGEAARTASARGVSAKGGCKKNS